MLFQVAADQFRSVNLCPVIGKDRESELIGLLETSLLGVDEAFDVSKDEAKPYLIIRLICFEEEKGIEQTGTDLNGKNRVKVLIP